LVYWTVKAACECGCIDKVYVATDSEEIKKCVEIFKEDILFAKVEVIGRSEESASDTASTESAMLEFAENYEFENIVLIQATSPLLLGSDLDKGFELFNQSNIEKSKTKKKEFIITNVSKGTYKIEITVYYQDLLKNWYKQKVHLTISVTNIYDSKSHNRNQINSVIVDDEEMLSKAPAFVKKIKKS